VFWAWAEEDDAAFAAAEVRGWRQWPLNQAQTFGSLFRSGGCTDDRCGGDSHPCKTGQPSAVELGTTDEWDDIIRVDDCVRTDVRSGWTSGGEGFRLMVHPRTFHQPRGITMCLEFSEPFSRKRFAFSIQALCKNGAENSKRSTLCNARARIRGFCGLWLRGGLRADLRPARRRRPHGLLR
jgi:hypothetical protein